MKRTYFFIFLLFCLGCASEQSVPLLSGHAKEGAPVCLADQSAIPAIVKKFYATRDLTTEEGKIDYLLERLRDSKLTFIRNRVEYKGSEAAEFLRWKLNRLRTRYHMKIETAQDFIVKITSGSRVSGEPYVIVLSDGSRHNLENVLQNELNLLESCLKQNTSKEEGSTQAATSTAST